MPTLNPELYTIAWIAPLEIEARAALSLFDKVHDGDFPLARGSDYVFHAGTVRNHNVVLATLPPGQSYGTATAGALAGQVKMFFPNLWFGLLVGVAAGLPNLSQSPPRDIRLGDVLVALPEGDRAGLVAYELGKDVGEDNIQLLFHGHALARTETIVRSAIGKIKLRGSNAFLSYYQQIKDEKHANGTFIDPGQDQDILYELDEVVSRPLRPESQRTKVWYGPIGSGEKLIENSRRRDELRDQLNIIGLEMGAAGTMNTIPVGVIRGVCDYADSHRNEDWQPYAAAMAAAYAKTILNTIQPKKVHHSHFVVPLGQNTDLVRRASILDQLLQRIPPTANLNDYQLTAIEGRGDVGKTQVALETADWVRDEYPDCSIYSVSFENA
ncbi:nucleoside phosphorylase domain-containing protein [Mariannaea sp. PMI_226]|nr:nucleoside phosphorylase domain-containing protein [Mariannaea sp. PMI_226]